MRTGNPSPEGQRIKALMANVENGDIKIPKFQRSFVWKQKSIISLLDSIYKGYPIGSLLFWRTNSKIKGERNLGGYELRGTKESYPTNYVLDGQQRLTTIYSVFSNRKNHPGMDEVFDINFDFNTKEFMPSKQASAESIPLHSLFDNKEFHNLTRDFDSDMIDLASDLQEIFMNYEVPVVTIFNADIEEVSVIFERINSTGNSLTVFDLMVAATWSEDFDLRDEIKLIKDDLRSKNFGNLDEITILKCLTVVMTTSQTRKAIFSLRDKISNLKSGLQNTRFGLFRAIDFLVNDLSVPSADFLPYDFQIVLLTFFFSNVSIPSPDMVNILRRWFWKSSFGERYQGANDTLLEKDLNDCKKLIVGNNETLFDFTPDISIQKLMKTEFKKGTAFSNAFIALLAKQKPRNLITGTQISVNNSLSSYNRKEFHHIFPSAYLKALTSMRLSNSDINSVCNIIILSSSENKRISSKAPSNYFSDIKKALKGEYNSVLDSNLLPTDDCSGIFENDYFYFIELRAELILQRINEYIL